MINYLTKLQNRQVYIILAVCIMVGIILWLIYRILLQQNILQPATKVNTTNLYAPEKESLNDLPRIQNENVPIVPLTINIRDNATHVPLEPNLIINFNRAIQRGDIDVDIKPSVPHTLTMVGANMSIDLRQPLQKLTDYTITVTTSTENRKTFSFSTTDPALGYTQDTYRLGNVEQSNEYYRTKHPTLFVANNAPHETATFLLEATYDKSSKDFLLTLYYKDTKEKALIEYTEWLVSLGMYDEQIQQISMDYRPYSKTENMLTEFRKQLPYQGENFRLDSTGDGFMLTLFGDESAGTQEFEAFLADNTITNKSILGPITIHRP